MDGVGAQDGGLAHVVDLRPLDVVAVEALDGFGMSAKVVMGEQVTLIQFVLVAKILQVQTNQRHGKI